MHPLFLVKVNGQSQDSFCLGGVGGSRRGGGGEQGATQLRGRGAGGVLGKAPKASAPGGLGL